MQPNRFSLRRPVRLLALLCLLLPGSLHQSARAATFNINNGDVAGLISALDAANTNDQEDTINLAAGGSYTLTAVNNTSKGPTGLPVIIDDVSGPDLTINGNGATIQRGSGSTLYFRILTNFGAGVTLNGLTLANGVATETAAHYPEGSFGGAIYTIGDLTLANCMLSGNFAYRFGGGLYNGGTLTLFTCTLSSNRAASEGGGLFNSGTVTSDNSTFSGNGLNSGAGSGGGIYNGGGDITLRSNTLSSNSGGLGGGGLYNNPDGGVATLDSCTVSGNHVDSVGGVGGGLYNDNSLDFGSSMTVTNSTLSDNRATSGGGLYNEHSPLTLAGSTLSYNVASDSGGGVLNVGGDATVRECIFSGNRVENFADPGAGIHGFSTRGGAIANSDAGQLIVNRCTFNVNEASGGPGGNEPDSILGGGHGGHALGGALFNGTDASLNLINSTFWQNSAHGGPGGSSTVRSRVTVSRLNAEDASPRGIEDFGPDGGDGYGAVFNQGTMSMTACTLTINTGGGGAVGIASNPKFNGVRGQGSGGIANDGGDATVRNTICANNIGENGGGRDVDGVFTSGGYNFIGRFNGSAGFSNGVNHNKVGTNAAPIDPKLSPLANNGGPTPTLALQVDSPALDAGNSFGLSTDQRGLTRPVNLSGITNASDGSDIGAYERATTAKVSSALRINDVTVAEGDSGTKNAVFTITRSGDTTGTSSVHYATANGTATAGNDYLATSGTRTFSPGQTTKTIAVQVLGDALDEANETFKVNLSNPVNASLADGLGVGTITDNDPLPALRLSDAPAKAEGNAGTTHNALFTVTLTGATGRTVTVHYATANGTATAGSDYTAATGTITFLPGQTSKTLPIQVKGDATVEPDETFKVSLSSASFATIVDSQGIHTITDDDASE